MKIYDGDLSFFEFSNYNLNQTRFIYITKISFMIVKQVARKVAYRMRHRCLNSHEQVKSRRLKKVLLILMTLLTIGTAVTTSNNNGGISTSKIMGIKVIFMICVVNYLRVVKKKMRRMTPNQFQD